MQLKKSEYNENVTDVDSLEKARIHEEAETERKLISERELTKRQLSSDKERTKQQFTSDKEKTRQGDNYLYRAAWYAVASAIASIAFAIAGYNGYERYTDLEMRKIQTPVCPPCPQVTCQPVTKQ